MLHYTSNDLLTLTGATILAGDDLRVVDGAALTVQGERILAIGAPVAGAPQLDLTGKLICPMFVDAHTHVGDTGAKELGVGLNHAASVIPPDGLKHRFLRSVAPDQLTQMMRVGLIDMLQCGVIACADFREQGLIGVQALRQAAADLPIHVVILGRMDETVDVVEMERQAHALLATADGLGVRDVEVYPAELLIRLREHYPTRLFAVHAAESAAAQAESLQTTGRTQVARVLDWRPDLLIHLVHATPADLSAIAAAGAYGVACVRSNGILGVGFPDLARWQQIGMRFALGTDNMMFVAPDMLREMDFASRLGRGLAQAPTAIDHHMILLAATIEGARALKLDNRIGSLAPGKEASFLVFDLDRPHLRYQHDPISAIVHRASLADIAAIYVRGAPLQKWLNSLQAVA
ncbi:MAG TPA: amidohydrolase family protein [Chloroflexi bacterium]|nr:amidohydrolase family protein [Chloroflexota bacterium]